MTSLDDQRRALEHVCGVVEDRGIEVVLLAGDTTHHARPTPEVLDVLGSFFTRLDALGAQVVCVAGNHDPLLPAVAQHFRGRVHVALEPRTFRLDGIDVCALPWLPDSFVRAEAGGGLSKEEVAARLTFAARSIIAGFRAQRRPGVPLVLVTHATVAGSVTPTGFSMGWVPGTRWVIPLEDIAEFELVIAGHVHKRQTFPPNVIVPGSLLPLDFSETEERGIVIAEPGALTEFVRIPTPVIVTADIFDRDGLMPWLNGPDVDGALVRIRLSCDEATAREFPPARIERALLDAGARKVQVELDVERPDRARDQDMTAELLPLTALGRYLEGREDLDGPARQRVIAAATIAAGEIQERQRRAGGGDIEVEAIEATDFIGIRSGCVRFDGESVIVLSGPNGAGKSSLGVDALRFALNGASRAGAKPSPALIREGSDAGQAAVTLRLADGRVVRVIRKLKRDGRGRVSTTLDVLERVMPSA